MVKNVVLTTWPKAILEMFTPKNNYTYKETINY